MASHPESTFASPLQSYRAAAGSTQEDLAERAGVSVRGSAGTRADSTTASPDHETYPADALGLTTYDREIFIETARHSSGPRAKAHSSVVVTAQRTADPGDGLPFETSALIGRER